MGLMVVHHRVKDFRAWKRLFDGHAPVREAAGLTDGRVYQTVDDPNDVVILLDMADVGKAKAFANSEDLKVAMQRAGVIDAPRSISYKDRLGSRTSKVLRSLFVSENLEQAHARGSVFAALPIY
jgi:hypothetical protein